ncbi:MAG: serine--tRNA ligase [Candidatus Colwellbacteria bacterium]|nr:serine--tRNA ligase [Candidatus Colwellbacteria bacterium]
MLDIKYIREHVDGLKKAIGQKHIELDLDKLLKLDEERREMIGLIDELRSERKKNADASAGASNDKKEKFAQSGRELKEKISKQEDELAILEEQFEELMAKVPVIPAPDTPEGEDDSGNLEIFRSQEPTTFKFIPKDHIELARNLDLIDFENGARVSGYRGYYVKNEAVMLQMGLLMHALQKAIKHGFKPIIPPTLVKEAVLYGSGYFAGRKFNPDIDEVYKIANDEKSAEGTLKKEDKFLIGTAEPSLLAYFADQVISVDDLPIKLCGFSQCYRSEIGSYGRDTKGLYRVHEFMKVELIAITPADIEVADGLHKEMVDLAKELHDDLEVPYRIIRMCTGALTAGKYKQFDYEAWTPSRNGWGETGSASNFLDWQARRLNVRYREKGGSTRYVYMLNATALPSPRPLIAILENHQTKNGSIKVPKTLRPYVGKKEIKRKG